MSPVRVATDGGLLEIVLDDPPVNALSVSYLEEIDAAVERAAAPDVRAVAMTSAVPRVFMAGADLAFLAEAELTVLRDYVAHLQDILVRLESLSVPVVIGVDGAALGGGLELSLCADVLVVAPEARLGLPEAQLGILPGAGGTQRLVRAVGQQVARDLLLTGRRLTGEEAVSFGLASRLAAPGGAGAEAREIAARLAIGSPEALAAIKRLALVAPETPLDEGLEAELDAWLVLRAGANAQEGLEAFAERRAPRFT
jgi:enoyl-CoA hydratase/carnithine racemase